MMIRTTRQRISKERDDWNSSINQLDLSRYGQNTPLKNSRTCSLENRLLDLEKGKGEWRE